MRRKKIKPQKQAQSILSKVLKKAGGKKKKKGGIKIELP